MSKRARKILTILLIAILSISLIMLIRQVIDSRMSSSSYDEAARLAGLQDNAVPEEPEYVDPYAIALVNTNLEELREVNSEVVGWISIPDTPISYPVMQNVEDGDFYLYHTWEKVWSAWGSIFMERRVSPDLSDFNSIVYGHRMYDDTMFSTLQYYADLSYWEEHPSIYMVIDEGVYRYDIYAAYEVGLEDITYRLHITNEAMKDEFIQYGLEQSVIDTKVIPTAQDRILTLSTCTGDGFSTRWVVQGVLGVGAPPWVTE